MRGFNKPKFDKNNILIFIKQVKFKSNQIFRFNSVIIESKINYFSKWN